MTKGRMREFYQCDFDIAGEYDPMLPDAEILRIICEVFDALGWNGKYTIKVNHRAILDGIFAACGVPVEKIRTISSAVDKLDKSPWADVKREMVEEKGLSEDVADRIWEFVQKKGKRDVLESLQKDDSLTSNPNTVKGMEDMNILFEYIEAFGVLHNIEFNLSLARGLDYYTGLIFEVVTEGSAPPIASVNKLSRQPKKEVPKNTEEDRSNDPSVGVGSVAAGGRYDGLVSMFSGKGRIPCVGISFGVDRIFSITKARMEAEAAAAVRGNEVDVYVMAFGTKGFQGLLKERMEVCKILWDAGIKVSLSWCF
jgi:histidyl-tRNA synthetase